MSIRVKIIDEEVLSSIDPKKLGAYLIRKGWTLGSVSELGKWYYYPKPYSATKEQRWEPKEFEILVPCSNDLIDYKFRMYEMFQVLDEAENRSQLDIWEDLK